MWPGLTCVQLKHVIYSSACRFYCSVRCRLPVTLLLINLQVTDRFMCSKCQYNQHPNALISNSPYTVVCRRLHSL